MNPTQEARRVLDRVRGQIDQRLPKDVYSGTPPKLELAELAELARVVRDWMDAEESWHRLADRRPWEAEHDDS